MARTCADARSRYHRYKLILSCVLFCLLTTGTSWAFENGDRPGGDYTSFPIPRNQPTTLCATACQRDPRCVAWTLDFRGSIETPMNCWLKNKAPPLQPVQQVFSGVKKPLESNVDRRGSDFVGSIALMTGASAAVVCNGLEFALPPARRSRHSTRHQVQ